MDEARSARPREITSDPKRLRRETRAESTIGAEIGKAAAEAGARAMRQQGYPPPTEAERALIETSPRQPVQLFTTVLLVDLQSGEQERFTLVPHDEADLNAGRISLGSPIGRAIYQEYPGAVVRVSTPGGPILYRVLQVQA